MESMTERPDERPGKLARLESQFAAILRLPTAGPDPPPGSGHVRVFRAAPNFMKYNVVRWVLRQVGAVIGLVVGVGFISGLPDGLWPLRIIEAIGVGVFVAQLPVSLAVVWIDFNRRWYLVTDRSLRIREGVWTVHERTMSFANVQNLEIRQGPVHRLLGIAALEVRSAGGGHGKTAEAQGGKQIADLHVAYFRGVDNAEEIRDLILARLRGLRDSGLGDLDDRDEPLTPAAPRESGPIAPRPSLASPRALAAARELLAEARALRASMR
jgi:membrane protein YdbS with pleckstrin-like domain